jgi:RNA polymerase sigma-70 factor (ECF subfamily)
MSACDASTELMIRASHGEAACMELLLVRHRDALVRFLYRMVQNQAVAEELAQDVFLRVHRASVRYEPTAKFTTWLYRIALRVALNWIRDHRHERSDGEAERLAIADGALGAEALLVREALAAEVRRAVAELPERQRAALIMHKYDNMDYVQIAAVLGCSVEAVKALMFRAHTVLRARLAHLAPQR